MRNDTVVIFLSILITAVLGGGGLRAIGTSSSTEELPSNLKDVARPVVVESATRTALVPILVYHTIRPLTPKDTKSERYYNTSPELFAKELAWLKDHGFATISFASLLDALKNGAALPDHSVILTFDDGNASHWQYAFPALQAAGAKGTFFIFSNAIDRPRWLTLEQLKTMQAVGMEIQGHTRYHPYLTKLDDATLDDELVTSKKILESDFNTKITVLAYPFGLTDERVTAHAIAAGYQAARTLVPGPHQDSKHLMELHASLMHEDWNNFLRAMNAK